MGKFLRYKAYICDSAIHYLRVNLDWAERYGRQIAALEQGWSLPA